MNVHLEHLELLPEIKLQLENQNSPFLDIHGAAEYTTLSVSSIRKAMGHELIEGRDFFKKGAKIIFLREALWTWVIGKENTHGMAGEKRKRHSGMLEERSGEGKNQTAQGSSVQQIDIQTTSEGVLARIRAGAITETGT